MILNNNINFKNKKDKKGEYLYQCIFKDFINNETIKINFELAINNEHRKNKELNINIDCLIIIPEFVYNYYIIKFNRNQIVNKIFLL